VLARHTGVPRLREGASPAHEVVKVLRAPDPMAVLVHDGHVPEINVLHARPFDQ
jgi:hypothetical protein